MNAIGSKTRYYYFDEETEKIVGPFDEAAFSQLIAGGMLVAETPVCRQGDKVWAELGQLSQSPAGLSFPGDFQLLVLAAPTCALGAWFTLAFLLFGDWASAFPPALLGVSAALGVWSTRHHTRYVLHWEKVLLLSGATLSGAAAFLILCWLAYSSFVFYAEYGVAFTELAIALIILLISGASLRMRHFLLEKDDDTRNAGLITALRIFVDYLAGTCLLMSSLLILYGVLTSL